jgi:predicted DNA-binding transcriptional regulator AlpA
MRSIEIINRTNNPANNNEAAETIGIAHGPSRAGSAIEKEDNVKISAIINRASDLVDEKKAAEILGVAHGTLQVWRSTGRYQIPFVKIGRLVRYRRGVLDTWIESRTRASGATE